jgi:hypothetical protein
LAEERKSVCKRTKRYILGLTWMKRAEFKFSFKDLNIDQDNIISVLGNSRVENKDMVSGMIGEVLYKLNEICDIRAEYIIKENARIDTVNKSIRIEDTDFNIGKIITAQLKRSESLAIFLCTAGKEVGEFSRKLMKEQDYLKGYISDIAGSEIVEAAADLMQDLLRKDMEVKGLKITNRFSPGYCGWNVAEQHKLFRFVPDNSCGIELLDSALMDPVKSISGVIGIGPDVKYKPYTCNLCDQENCIYRRNKNS